MTRARKRKQNESTKKLIPQSDIDKAPLRWINPAPNTQDIEWLENNVIEPMEDVIALFDGLRVGMRVTCKHDDRTTRWIAVLFDNDIGDDGAVAALSVRGATAFDAILVLAYFSIRKNKDDWRTIGGGGGGRFS